jgi:predicted hydrocarbon binding protein
MMPALDSAYPKRLGRIIYQAMEEILGYAGVDSILQHASPPEFTDRDPANTQDPIFPFERVRVFQSALEGRYGKKAGHGLSQRVGRACVKYGLREFGSEMGLTDLSFRLLPLPARLKVGSDALARLLNQITDQIIHLEFNERYITWQIERCPICFGRRSEEPCCALMVGLIQEGLYWVSGGKNFRVEEKKCVACGDSTCTIEVDQIPFD